MSKQHQKSEGLCNNREELTGKKLPFQGMESRILQTGTWYIDTELPSSSETSVQQRVQRFDML